MTHDIQQSIFDWGLRFQKKMKCQNKQLCDNQQINKYTAQKAIGSNVSCGLLIPKIKSISS